MENIISQIEKIREINNQHKLVVFVGAGVSKNSGVCSWWDLVKNIATKIGYDDICEKCKTKYEYHSESGAEYEFCNSNSECQWKYNFSADEFLKIPQYFFDIKGEAEYYDFLKQTFCKSYIPNDIDELIIDLNPEHIITTNYDHLLEDVVNPNVGSYAVIKNDKDLLEQAGHRYIIKMHGDIENIKELVLKEDDYLNYSQNHIIIETYIKSLLIDKTFLFVGYSLNDNNLSLIMSYIDYFVKDKKAKKRSPHYLVVNNISKPERETLYWRNKGVELVDLSKLNTVMKRNTMQSSIESEQGQSLYSFLKYLHDEKLPYFDDKRASLKITLSNSVKQFEAFKFISCTDLLKACCFSGPVNVIDSFLNFTDENEYTLLKDIFQDETDEASKIKRTFLKAGLYGIQYSGRKLDSYIITDQDYYEENLLFEMSLKNQYNEILHIIDKHDNKIETAYYYSLIYITNSKLTQLMNDIEAEIKSFNYHTLSIEQKYIIAIYKYNTICLRLLNNNHDNKELWTKLIYLLDSASHQSITFETIKKMSGKNGEILSTLNDCLSKHEEYYMKKSTTIKLAGTIYGDLFDLQSVVYDYYLFYKKNHLMLDWFNNVEKISEPYIKAILCTYYPDKYQFSNNVMGRTRTEPYPINLIDIDIIVKHTKLKNFNSWLSYYKVFQIKIDDSIDIVEIFENFCISMRCFWNLNMEEHLKVFSKLISLIELSTEQRHRILNAFVMLVKPDETTSIHMLCNNLTAVWIYVQKHYDSNDELYKTLLSLMVNEQALKNIYLEKTIYEKLVTKLSAHADEDIYRICEKIIANCNNKREKSYSTFVFRTILIQYNNDYWCEFIKSNINSNWLQEIYTYIESGIIAFDDKLKDHFDNMMSDYQKRKTPGSYTYPDRQKDTIEILLILLLTKHISSLDDIAFLQEYTEESEYLDFLFNPDKFDYSKINTADYMWCNFIFNDKYREIILTHKSEFWSADDEKRIELGFGSNFENRIAYKYLFE